VINKVRRETDSLGQVDVSADKLWGAHTRRSLEHLSLGQHLILREMITAYATLKNRPPSATTRTGGRTTELTG
jgi:fumarate hydratase class II